MKYHNNKSTGFSIGFADTKYGIETFRPTDEYQTFEAWKARMLKACESCQDKEYAKGVLSAFSTLKP